MVSKVLVSTPKGKGRCTHCGKIEHCETPTCSSGDICQLRVMKTRSRCIWMERN